MRIASFNLESLDTPPKAKMPLQERIKTLRPQLLRLEADILCLQEVNGQKGSDGERRLLALDALLAGTPYEDYHRAGTGHSRKGGAYDIHNLVTLSRTPFTSWRQIRHEFAPPLQVPALTAEPSMDDPVCLRFDRPLLHTALPLADGRTLHVINLHLRAPLAAPIPGGKRAQFVWNRSSMWAEGFYHAALLRTAQALEARLLVERLFDEDEAALVLICGDFNCEANEMPMRLMQAGEEDTGNSQLAGRGLVPPERSLPQDRQFSVLHHGRSQLLDHFLLSRDLMAHFQQIEIHNEALEDELVGFARLPRSPVSYHAPLLLQLRLKAA